MSCRVIPCSFGAAGLVFVAVALWLPAEVASRPQAEPEPEPATSDTKLIASESAFFVTFHPADFTGDELVKAIIQDLPKSIEEELHVATNGIERLTIAVGRHGPVQIVRTKKPYDADKLREASTVSRYGPKRRYIEKDGKEDPPARPAISEKKAGGKKIYYSGTPERWTQGWCSIDKHTFMTGSLSAIQTLLDTRGKPSAEMTDALALASKHSLVMALDGKRLRTMLQQVRKDNERERQEREKTMQKRFEERRKDIEGTKEGGLSRSRNSSRVVYVSAQAKGADGDKPKADDDDFDLLFDSMETGIVLLPYKPLLSAKFGLVTLDIGKTCTLTAKINFSSKDGADDGETALKSLLYVGRQLAVMLPKWERDFGGMKPLSVPARKAFENARVERKDTTLRTVVTLTPEAGLARKVRDGIEQERKKREKMYEKRLEGIDKSRFDDKAKVKD